MVRLTNEFLSDFKKLLEKHNVELSAADSYDGNDEWCGVDVVFSTKDSDSESLPIYIDDMIEFSKILNRF